MKWLDETSERGVRDRTFEVQCEGRKVPGALWTPADAAGPLPLVLLGHGGGLHKRAPYILAVARRLVRHHGIAAAAIDGPDHGARRPDGGLDFEKVWAERLQQRARPRPEATDEMVADWKATLAELRALPEVGAGPLGYWGLSMGTMYGLPFVAAESTVQVAVLGLMGIPSGETAEEWQVIFRKRLSEDARKVACPVLFLAQSDDELVARADALALFDALATPDRCLHLNPGVHTAVPPEEFDFSVEYLAKRLTAGSRP
jgi:dienelactone hydrolase